MATRYIMAHEVIKQKEEELLMKFQELPINGKKTDAKTRKKIIKAVRDTEFLIARKCNVAVRWQTMKICGNRVELADPRILLPSLRYVSYEELKELELGYGK